MTYKVVLLHNEEGYAVSAPELPGCASQGATAEEAVANIQDAIHEYLDVSREQKQPLRMYKVDIREVQVA